MSIFSCSMIRLSQDMIAGLLPGPRLIFVFIKKILSKEMWSTKVNLSSLSCVATQARNSWFNAINAPHRLSVLFERFRWRLGIRVLDLAF
jgi:hypothetical protein